MKSSLLHTGLGYVYSLDDEFDGNLARIEVTQLRSVRGSLMALLSVSSAISTAKRLPGSDRVTSAEVWLLSDRGRSSFAKYVSDLIPAPVGAAKIDWNSIMEDVCQQVVAAENRPLEVIDLVADMATMTRFIVPGLVPEGKPTILYGAGGTGKSAFAAVLALCMELGRPFLGLPVARTRTLYLDWETDAGTCAYRFAAAARGMGLNSAPPIRYVSLVRPIEDVVAQLATTVAEEQIGAVIIDSVGMAMVASKDGADASEGAIRFFRALRALNTAVIAIDHISGDDVRRGSKGAAKPYGSVYKWNSARNAFELRVAHEDEPARLVLKHRKSNLGPHQPDMNLLYQWEGDQVRITPEDDNVREALPLLVDRVADTLVLGPARPGQIADMLTDEDPDGVTELQVRGVLKNLLGAGRVQVMADGMIRLAKPIEEPVESEE